jgi:thiaminase
MVTYNPNSELTDEELSALNEADFFSYLDQKAAYLKQFTRPLGSYETKHFAAWSKGDTLTTEELRKAKEIGKQGDEARMENIAKAAEKLGGDPKFKDAGIKNIKTNRTQWFD